MSEMESELSTRAFVRQELVPERAAPIKTTGFVGFLRTRLFNSPINVLLTIGGILLLWFTVVPSVKFLLVDAVWTGTDRTACLEENVGRTVRTTGVQVAGLPTLTPVILNAAKDLAERPDTVRVAGARSFAALRTTRKRSGLPGFFHG